MNGYGGEPFPPPPPEDAAEQLLEWQRRYGPPCLLPDDDTAVERLAAALRGTPILDWRTDEGVAAYAAAIIAALRGEAG